MIETNLSALRARMDEAARGAGGRGEDVLLVAATKARSPEEIARARCAGVGIAGENRVKELEDKLAQGAYDGLALHFIGHLQTNKVRAVVGHVQLIQSVDSLRLAREIDRAAAAQGIVQDILLEINIGSEPSKHGFSPEEIARFLPEVAALPCIYVRGLMTVAPRTDDLDARHAYFAKMRQLFIDISKERYNNIEMKYLSMGMSMDYAEAIAEGANMIRVGTGIFGPRPAV